MTRIMVTGGAGFFGTPVVRKFRELGHDVTVPRSFEYDLRDRFACAAALVDLEPEIVVHMAAHVGGIGANAAAPGEFLFDNAVMGLHLMEQARRIGVRKFVTIGTVCEYPMNPPVPFREDDLWDGYPTPVTAPYGLAKKLLLVQAQAYRDQYDFDSIHLIPTNLYGPGDNFDIESGHVVPGLIRKVSQAMDLGLDFVDVWGTGAAAREFLFIEDAARAVVMATGAYSGRDPVNLGTGIETPIGELARMIGDEFGFEGRLAWDSSRPDGQPRRSLDVSRAREFGFTAEVGLREGLHETVAWFKENVR